MRVIGELTHPQLKITIFSTTTRFPVQFEDGDLAQIVRLRKGEGMETLEDVKLWVDAQLIEAVQQAFVQLRQQVRGAHQRKYKKNTNNDLPKII